MKRCPHCQTTPLRADAEICWYCGRDYVSKPKARRAVRTPARGADARRRAESRPNPMAVR
jgi:hypothetical protein